MRSIGYALQYAVADPQFDREAVMEAVHYDVIALHYAAADMESERKMVLAFERREANAVRYAHAGLKSDPGSVRKPACSSGYAVQFAVADLEPDRVLWQRPCDEAAADHSALVPLVPTGRVAAVHCRTGCDGSSAVQPRACAGGCGLPCGYALQCVVAAMRVAHPMSTACLCG